MFKFLLKLTSQRGGRTTYESMARHHTGGMQIFINIYLCSKHFFPSIVLIPFFLFAVSWHYSLGCFICGNTRKTFVSTPYVTTAKVCVYKTITGYLPFIVHCSFYVRCLNLMLHGWKYCHAIKLEHMPCATYHTFYLKTLSNSKVSLCNISDTANQVTGATLCLQDLLVYSSRWMTGWRTASCLLAQHAR